MNVTRITVYPIKSLDGVAVERSAFVGSGALEHDRRFAMVDAEGRIVNGKRSPAVHPIRARYDLAAMSVALSTPTIPEQRFALEGDRAALGEWLSAAVGARCTVVEDREGGYPDDTDAPGPTLVGAATLEAVASWFPGLSAEEVGRRLRANLVVEAPEPFWEDRLVAAEGFKIGDTAFQATCVCQRCVVPTRDPLTAERTHGFQKHFAERREATLPPLSPRAAFDHFFRVAINTRRMSGTLVRVGDAVTVSEPATP